MSLSASRLTTNIVNALKTLDPSMTTAQITQLTDAWTQIAGCIVTEITSNAVVNPNTLNNPAGQPVQVTAPSYTGATTSPQIIAGTGTVS